MHGGRFIGCMMLKFVHRLMSPPSILNVFTNGSCTQDGPCSPLLHGRRGVLSMDASSSADGSLV